eukprot:891389-Pelagomonas_calceolata.AAC.1
MGIWRVARHAPGRPDSPSPHAQQHSPPHPPFLVSFRILTDLRSMLLNPNQDSYRFSKLSSELFSILMLADVVSRAANWTESRAVLAL